MAPLKYWIWLSTLQGLGDRAKLRLLEHFSSPEEIYYAQSGDLLQVEGITKAHALLLENKSLQRAEQVLGDCARDGQFILTMDDAAYPTRLRDIFDPPLVLYGKGSLPLFDEEVAVAVVGTRKCSPYGVDAAGQLGYELAREGALLVSGMAKGIDSEALRGALRAGGFTAAVLGGGVDVVYPAENRRLYEDIAATGVILSEYPPGTEARGSHFPVRNRILSGLCLATLVVEAPEKSGALITARQAADQGRDVFAVPGNIDVPSCVGSNRLLRDGATLVTSGWDIMCEYQDQFPGRVRAYTAPGTLACYGDEVPEFVETPPLQVAQMPRTLEKKPKPKPKKDKKVIDKRENTPYIDLNDIKIRLSPEEAAIAQAIGAEERLVDDVIAQAGLPAGKVLATLTLMEVKGLVRRLPGRRVTLRTKGKQ